MCLFDAALGLHNKYKLAASYLSLLKAKSIVCKKNICIQVKFAGLVLICNFLNQLSVKALRRRQALKCS